MNHRTRFVVGAVATLAMTVTAVLTPELRYPSLFFVLLGLTFTWREYQAARPN